MFVQTNNAKGLMQRVFVASAVAGYTPRRLRNCGGKDQIELLKQPRKTKKETCRGKGSLKREAGESFTSLLVL